MFKAITFNYFPCFSPLHIAARQGLTPVVQDLIAKGASLTATDNKGQGSRLYCTYLSYLNITKGASLTATDNKGQVSGYTVFNYHTFISPTVPV